MFILYVVYTVNISHVPFALVCFAQQIISQLLGQPVTESDGYILVTSTCDTNDSTIVPVVNIQEGIIDVQLPGVTVGSQMDFLQSSSYEASWIETGCGFYEAGDIPDWPSDSTTGGGGEVTTVEPTTCLTEQDCNQMRSKMNIGAFYSGSYRTKGEKSHL